MQAAGGEKEQNKNPLGNEWVRIYSHKRRQLSFAKYQV